MKREPMSNEVAVASVPSLVKPRDTSSEYDADDILIKGLYVVQYMSNSAKEGYATAGDLIVADGADDEDPTKLWSWKNGKDEPGVKAHVLSMRKGWSKKDGDSFEVWAYNDPDRDKDADRTYNYFLCLPDVDDELPFKLTLSRSGEKPAGKMNRESMRHANIGPSYEIQWSFKTIARDSPNGKFFVLSPTQTEPSKDDLAIA